MGGSKHLTADSVTSSAKHKQIMCNKMKDFIAWFTIEFALPAHTDSDWLLNLKSDFREISCSLRRDLKPGIYRRLGDREERTCGMLLKTL